MNKMMLFAEILRQLREVPHMQSSSAEGLSDMEEGDDDAAEEGSDETEVEEPDEE